MTASKTIIHPSIASTRPREAGLSLFEMTIALVLLSVLVMAMGATLIHGMEQRRDNSDAYGAVTTLRTFIAEAESIGNQPQDLPNDVGIGALYDVYHGKVFGSLDMADADISVTCYPDEATVPAVFGGPQDLNFDGDADDDLGGAGNGTDLKLVPMEFALTYQIGGVTYSMVAHRLITKTSN